MNRERDGVEKFANQRKNRARFWARPVVQNLVRLDYSIPWSWWPAGAGFSFSGSSVTRHSVVSKRPAIEAAFWSALRVTFFGSTTPALTRSSYSPVATL